MNNSNYFTIKPAGRHILTIGRDLIQDQYAAVVELIKNAYDADAANVNIRFETSKQKDAMTIIIEDNGHGMSRDTVINKWLVPSTDDKIKRRVSPKGRIMQGRKGVGRYAASILGKTLSIETTNTIGETTTLKIKWSEFEEAQYLEDVKILVETSASNKSAGTKLTIEGNKDHIASWSEAQIKKLRFELKKLIPPIQTQVSEDFTINLTFKNFISEDIDEIVEPYPIFQLYDYSISGEVDENGKGRLVFRNQRAKNIADELINFDRKKPTGCGKLIFDIRVYDRERDAIELLIKRGLKDEKGNYVGKTQARQLLNQYNGLGVYRNGFRIRPLGDPDFDWLKLNEQRIQNPSLRISSNQVIGYVQIQSEEFSKLEEKSARDGLKENSAYEDLKKITTSIISELESRRFEYRKRTGLSRKAIQIERNLERLFAFDDVKQGVRRKLDAIGVDITTTNEIVDIITQKEEENNRIAEDIRSAVAIYQGQATLGKIINVVLHEGRQPLNFFTNQIPILNFWAEEIKKNYDPDILNEITNITEGIGVNAKTLVRLFGRLDPLAAGDRGAKKRFNLLRSLQTSFHVFEEVFIQRGITFTIDCPKDLYFEGWEDDIYTILTNLVDNSIFWMQEKSSTKKKIDIIVHSQNNVLDYIDYRDTGPGIEPIFIESEVIFEPHFTTKPGGSGIGLAIAGEAAQRNGFDLKAFQSDDGAYFRLQTKREEDDE